MPRRLTLDEVMQRNSVAIYRFGDPVAFWYDKGRDFGDFIEFNRQITVHISSKPYLFKDKYETSWVAYDEMPTPLQIIGIYSEMLRRHNATTV